MSVGQTVTGDSEKARGKRQEVKFISFFSSAPLLLFNSPVL
jgi:hypothetical protein